MKKILNCHPSLYYTVNDLQRVKDRIQTDAEFANRFAALQQKADGLMSAHWLSQEECNSVYSQHGRYFEPGGMLEQMAGLFPLLSYVTGDEKYFAFAKEKLLYYAAFKVWTGPENHVRRTPWHSELATTRFLNGYSQLYDAYYDSFSETERDVIAAAMMEKGIDPLYADWVDPIRRVHALDSMGHNWWSVCIGYCGIGVMTLFDRLPNADEKLTRITKAMEDFCTYQGHTLLNKIPNFDSKGMFYESAGYFSYGVGELLNFRLVLHRLTDYRLQAPVLNKVGDAILSMVYPVLDSDPIRLVNFGDSNVVGSMINLLCKMLLLGGLGDARHGYCYHQCNEDSSALDLIYTDLLHPETDVSCFANMAKEEMYPETGYGFWRSGWEQDATLFGIRCGYTWNHAHNDAGSFILWHKGKQLLTDSGSTNYNSPHYRNYFTAAQAHNLVTIKGREETGINHYRGTKFRGTMPEYHHADWLSYCLCDATGPSADVFLRNYRNIIKLDEELFVVIDDLLCHKEEIFAWLLHYEGQETVTDHGIHIQNEDAAVDVYPVYPPCHTTVETAPAGGAYSTGAVMSEEKTHYIKRETITATKDACFIHVLSLSDLTVTPLSGDSYQGVQLEKGGVTWRVYYNKEADGRKMHENSNNRVGDYDTDGYIVVDRTQNGQVKRFMAYGSYLRLGDAILFDDFTKQFVFVE
ncbi:MAG: heparinase II/III-family protein [Clostridia bacterium]|nr:heparinase II/III-family protein [Clostridia bacterium]